MSRDAVRLDRGTHPDAGAGCCLMEYVSVLDGARFGPFPRCTHPAVAALASQVNDHTSDGARGELAGRAQRLRHADSDDPGVTWALVEVCAGAVLDLRPGDAAARRRLHRSRRAAARLRRVLPRGVLARAPRPARLVVGLGALDELTRAFHAVLTVAGPAGSTGSDRTLAALLDDALAVVGTRTHGTPATHVLQEAMAE
jgi:hypothetical protein